jgi:hypothetical protein
MIIMLEDKNFTNPDFGEWPSSGQSLQTRFCLCNLYFSVMLTIALSDRYPVHALFAIFACQSEAQVGTMYR